MTSGPLSTQGVDNALNLSKDPLFQGFDQQAGQSWIYPTNYPVRDYQFNIIQEALHKNTLVSLPTGLGKTFIAAVVMYNYFRWYPHGKLIFMAPTRPLVKQQVDACYSIMAFPKETTAELTGTTAQSSRSDIWKEKRVFFVTPQVLQNDLATIVELGPKIKCLVFDEAHRAKGNHAYCEVIRRLTAQTAGLFRVLALSATPGNSVPDILEVVKNLKISHLEFRTEESEDVKNYVFQRSLETIVVPLGEKLEQVRDDYLQILEVYTRTLLNYKVIHGNCATLTKGKIFVTMREYQKKNQGKSTPNYSEIMKTLNVCVTLYHAYEVLVRHGLRGFLNFFEEHIDKPLLRGNRNLLTIMQDIREYLGPAPNIEALPDGTFTDLSKDTKFGHPKYYQLRDVLNQHFSSHSRENNSTRVIVFFEYRESVMEAYALLLQSRPAIRPRIFLGQGSGITQKIQLNVVKAFREGTCNTLLSTCIGEEGLDVGQVDLIVCFDISNKSPIRMIQRMGRTGRQKEGRVIVLVTEGKEQQTLKECIVYKNNLGTFVLNSRELRENLGEIESPRMIPPHIAPKCEKMFMTVEKPALPRKNCNLKDLLRNLSHDSPKFSPGDDDVEIVEIRERIRGPQQFWNRANPLGGIEEAEQDLSFSKNLERQRALQATGQVKHTKHSEMLVSLLQFADSKRFNIPMTQLNSNFLGSQPGKSLKQGDIRNMFSNLNTVNSNSNVLANIEDFKIPETLQAISDSNSLYPSELFTEISNFLSIKLEIQKKCLFCTNFQCPKDFMCFSYTSAKFSIDVAQEKQWIVPDLDILNQITAEDFDNFTRNLMNPVTKLDEDDLDNVFGESLVISEVEFSKIENDFEMEKSTEIQRIAQESFKYETPKSFSKILSRFSVTSQDIPRNSAETGLGAVSRNLGIFDDPETSKNDSKIAPRKSEFSGIVTDDSTIELSKKQGVQKCDSLTKPSASLEQVQYVHDPQNSQEILNFFKLDLVSDLFASENKTCEKSDSMTDLDRTVLYNTVTGPEKFESSPKKSKHFCPSPDLFDDCSPSPKKQISTTPCTKEKLGSQENSNIDAAYYFGHSETPCMSRKIPPKPGPSKSGFLDENFVTPGISGVPQISSSPVLSLRDRTLRTPKTTQGSTSSRTNYYINNSELSPQKSWQNSQIISEDSQSPVLSARDCTLIRRKMAKKRILNEEKSIWAVQKPANQNLRNFEKNSQDPVGHDAAAVDVSMDLNDVCDLGTFGLRRDKSSSAPEKSEHRQKTKLPPHHRHHQQAEEGESFRNTTPLEELDISDICNLTAFGISNQSNKQKSLECKIKSLVEKSPTELAGVPASLDVTDICDISGLLGTFSTSQNNPSLKISDNCPQGRSLVENSSSFSQNSPGKIGLGSLQKSPAKPTSKFDLFPVTSESPKSKKLKVSQDCSPNLTELSKIDTSPVSKKSRDLDLNSPETKNVRQSKFDSCQERNDNVSLTDLSDFCDISNLMPITDGNIRMTDEQNCQSNAVIDLTDSCDSSPIKSKFTQEKIRNATPQTLLSKYFDSSFTSKPSTSKSLLQLRKTGNKATSTCTGPSSAIKNSPKEHGTEKPSSKSTPERGQKQSNSSFSLLDSTNSDEDFEEKTPIVVKIPRKNQRKTSQTSSSQCQRKIQFSSSTSSSTSSPSQIPRNNPNRNVASVATNMNENSKKITKKLPRKNVFIDDEAVLSEDENVNVSQDETLGNSDDSDLDRYEMSFVANDDDTECFLPNTQVHADYMKSVRSPVLHRGKFKIPQRPIHNVTNVYSQPEITINMDNTYLDDTFCVTNDNEDDSDETNKDGGGTSKHELSELEILEQKLEEMRKNKRKNKESSTSVKNNDNSKKNKRRRIIVSDDDDSD